MIESYNNSLRGTVLEKIALQTQVRVMERRQRRPISELMLKVVAAPEPLDFVRAFRTPGPHIIAEIKRQSPSAGVLAADADPNEVARQYLENGATAISVLTETDFFNGNIGFLKTIRHRFPQSRLLMKDFVLEEYQIMEGRCAGADAVLLIAALLSDERLERLFAFARTLGLTPLVEVHDEEELSRAIALGADCIGVNNRNLRTMEVSLDVSRRLAPLVPRGRLLIAESGLRSGEQIRELSGLGYRGFLVGTSLMSSPAPGQALAALKGEAS